MSSPSLPNPDHVLRLAQELKLQVHQVMATAQLFAEGATVPFISRYRKEVTGMLDEVQVTAIRDRLEQMKAIDERRASILASLKERNLLNPALEKSIMTAETLTALEDITQWLDHHGSKAIVDVFHGTPQAYRQRGPGQARVGLNRVPEIAGQDGGRQIRGVAQQKGCADRAVVLTAALDLQG